jgi:hypothetical protein
MTEFVNEIKGIFPAGGEHWYELSLSFSLCCGSCYRSQMVLQCSTTKLLNPIIEPYVAPVAKTLATKVEGWIAVM